MSLSFPFYRRGDGAPQGHEVHGGHWRSQDWDASLSEQWPSSVSSSGVCPAVCWALGQELASSSEPTKPWLWTSWGPLAGEVGQEKMSGGLNQVKW